MIKVFSKIINVAITLIIFGCFCVGYFFGKNAYIFGQFSGFLFPVFGLIIGFILSAVIFGPILILISIQETVGKIEKKISTNN